MSRQWRDHVDSDDFYDGDSDWWNEFQAMRRDNPGIDQEPYEPSQDEIDDYNRDMETVDWGIPSTPPENEDEPPF